MTKPAAKGTKSQFQIRLDDEAEGRIEKYRKSVEKETGLEVSFASAARALIMKGLDAAGV
jgi:hypothetical protein